MTLTQRQLPSMLKSASSIDIDSENRAAIALLQSWLMEDTTDDPDQIRQAQADLEEFKQSLNTNRAETGERRVFS